MRSLVLTALGALAILMSLAFRWLDFGGQSWTAEKAATLQAAQSTLHRLGGHGDEFNPRSTVGAGLSESDEYQNALAAHRRLRAELDATQGRGQYVANGLMIAGIVLVGAGWAANRRSG